MVEKFKPEKTPPANKLELWKRRRRKKIKRFGKALIRSLGDFLSRQSLVADRPVFETKDFAWALELEKNAEAIRAEARKILSYREMMPAFHELSPDQAKISRGKAWKTFVLFGFGKKAEGNCRHCPETPRVLESIPNMKTAFFSVLSPGTEIPAHRGITKGVIRAHLALITPKDRENCMIRIDQQNYSWDRDRCLVFDDTYEHEVWNRTDEDRIVLLIDVLRPMRFWGRLVNWIFLSVMAQTGYVRDARRNAEAWSRIFEEAVRKGEAKSFDRVA